MSKNKKNVIRITICIFAFLAVFITGKFVDMNLYASLAIYGAIYVASGYDVLLKRREISLTEKFSTRIFL